MLFICAFLLFTFFAGGLEPVSSETKNDACVQCHTNAILIDALIEKSKKKQETEASG